MGKSTPSPKEVRRKRLNRMVVVSLQAFPVSIEMNLRTSSYASLLCVKSSATVRVNNAEELFALYQADLARIPNDIGEALANECYEEARKICRRYTQQEYIALEEELDLRMRHLLNSQRERRDVLAHIDIVNIHFHVNLTAEHEQILHKAAFADYENSAKRAELFSSMENMHVMKQVMDSTPDADVWLEVAQGRMTATQAVDLINRRKQEQRDREIDRLREIGSQGVMSDADMSRYMKDVLDNAVDRASGAANRKAMLTDGKAAKSPLPDASDIPDLD